MVVNVDNVGSNQMHQIRQALRGKGVVLMGKNTQVRRAVRGLIAENPQYERFLPHVRGNVGFVFTDGDLKEVRDLITANKVAAPAKAGALAPADVFIPAGPTGMDPGKTSFFQALGIPTKIARGMIEIVSEVRVTESGGRVGPSEATLLNMLNISPCVLLDSLPGSRSCFHQQIHLWYDCCASLRQRTGLLSFRSRHQRAAARRHLHRWRQDHRCPLARPQLPHLALRHAQLGQRLQEEHPPCLSCHRLHFLGL